jgi:hypothetical protein
MNYKNWECMKMRTSQSDEKMRFYYTGNILFIKSRCTKVLKWQTSMCKKILVLWMHTCIRFFISKLKQQNSNHIITSNCVWETETELKPTKLAENIQDQGNEYERGWYAVIIQFANRKCQYQVFISVTKGTKFADLISLPQLFRR